MSLSPMGRIASLERLRSGEQLDVLVVGGGVVGCGVALDAVTRGLSTGLVEARDFASGTSSRSSKLIHGGLRYLEMLDFELVHEALQERGLLLRTIAPHLVRPVPFMYPLTKPGWERFYVGSGVALYDGLAFGVGQGSGMPRHRHLTKKKALALMPSLRPDALTGAVQYYDAQLDDARFVLELARTASRYGATCVNRVAMTGVLREGDRVVGIRAVDHESAEELAIRARCVISATGVWTDQVEAMAGAAAPLHVTASKGVHLVVPKEKIRSDTGVILRTEKSVLFIIPWDEHWLIGTTDTPWDHDLAHPAATRSDIDYLLDTVNAVLVDPLTDADIDGVYVGLRPLVAPPTEPVEAGTATTRISREHVVAQLEPGLVAVAGGKYTTYRVMAKDALDLAAADLPMEVSACRTDTIALAGARGFDALSARPDQLAAGCGLDGDQMTRLLERYGSLVLELIALVNLDPRLRAEVPGSEGHLAVEIAYAASSEGALHLTDVMTRRTRISIEARDRGLESAPHVAALMAPILGWDEARTADEIDVYHRRVQAEMTSQTMPDDASADQARREAPDGAL